VTNKTPKKQKNAQRLEPRMQDDLNRWVEAGLISSQQALTISAFVEKQANEAQSEAAQRMPLFAEAVGYLAGMLITGGTWALLGMFWVEMSTAVQLLFLGTVAGILFVAGAAVPEKADPAFARLRAVIWLVSVSTISGFAGVFGNSVLGFESPEGILLFSSTVTAAAAFALWGFKPRPLQQLASFTSVAIATISLIAMGEGSSETVGFAMCVLGAAWTLLAWRQLVPPQKTGYLLGTSTLLVSVAVAAPSDFAHLFGLGTAVALLAIATIISEAFLLVVGLAGLFVYTPWTIFYYFSDWMAGPFLAILLGLLLLAAALGLSRIRPRITEVMEETRS